ncbi:hypothetical protein [Treponema bryantii]|uniref:hypothetical protein n=1 Tax=Treponema bryantii TaxID=163 RepID=UPI002B307609|nr:hypothetical protein TRBR_13060 [Treponema bryantii]
MKKNFLLLITLFVIIINCNANEKKESYLQSFFADNQYKTDYYNFNDLNICFSYIYAKNSSAIINKGVFYYYLENKIYPVLIIENEKIFNNSKLLFQGMIQTQKFYGYKVKVIEKNKCITTEFYTNEGKNVTDGPTFLWNTKNQTFSIYEVDRSQW